MFVESYMIYAPYSLIFSDKFNYFMGMKGDELKIKIYSVR